MHYRKLLYMPKRWLTAIVKWYEYLYICVCVSTCMLTYFDYEMDPITCSKWKNSKNLPYIRYVYKCSQLFQLSIRNQCSNSPEYRHTAVWLFPHYLFYNILRTQFSYIVNSINYCLWMFYLFFSSYSMLLFFS